jgi:A/G-specific adenine glycosylase
VIRKRRADLSNLALRAKVVRPLLSWFATNARDLPWRDTRDPYAIWISEIMLQQTQVKTVIPYWNRWMGTLPTVNALARCSTQRLLKLWEGLGYYSRVHNAHKSAQLITSKYNGTFPRRYEDVLELPGIGRYTAGAICSIAYNQPRPVLDGNVMRVLTRIMGIFGDPRKNPAHDRLWALAGDLVRLAHEEPRAKAENGGSNCGALNQALMELGALICTPREPKCRDCPLASACWAFQNNRQTDLPVLGLRDASSKRRFAAFVLERNRKVLIRQRPGDVVNAHLWEFPNREVGAVTNVSKKMAEAELKARLSCLDPWFVIRHSITRYRISLEVFRAISDSKSDVVEGIWVPTAGLGKYPFSSAHRKIALSLKDRR